MSQLFQDSLVPWEKTAGCDANTSNAKSVESAPEPMSSVGRIASLLIFPFQGDFSPFYGFGVATPPLGYAPLPKNYFQEELRDARKRGVSVNTLSAELKAAGITISSGALAKYLSRRSSNSATKRTTTAAKPNHVPQPHGQVKTGTKEPEHRESATGPK